MRSRLLYGFASGLSILALVAGAACTTSRPEVPASSQPAVDTAFLQRPFELAPPDDWMLTQRLTGGTISMGSLQRATVQAQNLEGTATAANGTGNTWQLVGPTNI